MTLQAIERVIAEVTLFDPPIEEARAVDAVADMVDRYLFVD